MTSKRGDYRDYRTEYVQSPENISLRNLAKKWGKSFGTIASQNKREGWADLRTQYQHKLATAIEEKSISATSDKAAGIVSSVQDSLDQCVLRAAIMLNDGMASRDIKELRAVKLATQTINNLNRILDDVYHVNEGGSGGISSEELSDALDTLAGSPDTVTLIPRKPSS